jgi:hypothetical protein
MLCGIRGNHASIKAEFEKVLDALLLRTASLGRLQRPSCPPLGQMGQRDILNEQDVVLIAEFKKQASRVLVTV